MPARLLRKAGVPNVAPVVEATARVARDSARVVGVLGVDLLAESAFRPFVAPGPGADGGSGGVAPGVFLTVPGAAVLSRGTADDLGVALGDTLGLRVDGRAVTARLVGLLNPADRRSASALSNLVLVDVATAQEWTGRTGESRGAGEPSGPASTPDSASAGTLSRVDLIVPDGAAGVAMLARVRALLPPGVEVRPATGQAETLRTMTAAFRLNLRALSLLALVVGLFLIYNTVTFAVVQRRRVLGTFRALGVTRGEVFRLVLGEALAVGVVGTALGLALGVALGSALVGLVTQTITDLYFVVRVRELDLNAASLARGVALGLGATLLGALRPGWEAASVTPASALRRSTEEDRLAQGAGRLALVGAGTIALGGGLLAVRVPAGSGGIALAYVGLLAILVGFAVTVPWLTRGYAALARPVAGALFGPVGRMAARGISASLSRTAVAVAALTVAVAATVGVSTMVASFRTTVVDWLGSVLQADVYISPPAAVFRRGGGILDAGLYTDLASMPGVVRADGIRVRTLETEQGAIDLVVGRVDTVRTGIYRFKEGDAQTAARDALRGSVSVSEPFGFRFDVQNGDTLTLQTDAGPQRFPVSGVYYDYGNDLGVVLMDERTFLRYYRDPGRSGVALTAAPGTTPEALVQAATAVA
ncbi:MAG TPA: ABC transporter permease, partial [Rubricoccaceae bacterium]